MRGITDTKKANEWVHPTLFLDKATPVSTYTSYTVIVHRKFETHFFVLDPSAETFI